MTISQQLHKSKTHKPGIDPSCPVCAKEKKAITISGNFRSEHTKNPAAVALGRLGGLKGGLAKVPKGFAMLTPEQRAEMYARSRKAREANKQAATAKKPK